MRFPSHDPAWQAVAALLSDRAMPFHRVLAPEPFRAVLPMAESYADGLFDPEARYDWIVVHKDATSRLRRSLLAGLDEASPVLANAVFVVFARTDGGLPRIGDDDAHVQAFARRRRALLHRPDPVPPDSPADDPLRWFTSEGRLQHVLAFLDATADAASNENPQPPTTPIPMAPQPHDASGGVAAPRFPPLQTTPVSRPDAAATVFHPIGDIRRFLDDVKTRGFTPRGLVDVGANLGNWTRMALGVFPDLRFVLIEPQQELAPGLMELLAGRVDCHLVQAGAGRARGHAIQTISTDPGASSFLPVPDAGEQASGRQRATPIIRIDDLFGPDGPCRTLPPDLVKMDIQGFEMEALAGAEQLFGTTELFIIETSLYEFMPRQPLAREVVGFMASRGYEIYDIPDFGRRPHDGALGQIDIAFVRSAGLLRSTNAW